MSKKLTQWQLATNLAAAIVGRGDGSLGLRKCNTRESGAFTLVVECDSRTWAKRLMKEMVGDTLSEQYERWIDETYGSAISNSVSPVGGDRLSDGDYEMLEKLEEYVIGKEISMEIKDDSTSEGVLLVVKRTPLKTDPLKVIEEVLGTDKERREREEKAKKDEFNTLLRRLRAMAINMGISSLDNYVMATKKPKRKMRSKVGRRR